jgi:iron complex outermembrane recepter protein
VVDWFKIRGNWGTAFNAPSLADTFAVDNRLLIVPAFVFPNPLPGMFTAAQRFWNVVATQGGTPSLKPQTAHTYEFGTDITLPFARDVKFSATYYHINFDDAIGLPPVGNLFNFYSFYQAFYTMNPTPAQVNALAAQVPGGLAQVAPLFLPGAQPIYATVDARRGNLGPTTVSGLDLAINYAHKTGFGSVDASLNGSYDLKSKTAPLPGLPFVDNLAINQSKYRFAANGGANVGDLRAQLTWNYVAGFDNTPSAANNNQSHIASFSIFRLFLRYDFSHRDLALAKNLSATLTIDNLFDRNPPFYAGTYNNLYQGYANGSTVGRLVQVGLSKKF